MDLITNMINIIYSSLTNYIQYSENLVFFLFLSILFRKRSLKCKLQPQCCFMHEAFRSSTEYGSFVFQKCKNNITSPTLLFKLG